jgi:predicted TIM-barrel fold metal-dependent hydrolase
MSKLDRIDTHAHFLPKFYRDALVKAGHSKPDGMPAIPEWDERLHLDFMKRSGISKSYLSISSPGVHFGDDTKAIALAQQVNDLAANLTERFPDNFGSFASLPLPDLNAAIKEIARACDELHADGFTLLTNYHGIYLGDEQFDPVFEELNRRKAKVFLHPTTGCSCIHGQPQPFRPLPFPSPVIEFFFDTARAVVNMIMSGTISRYPDITFLIPHCGAVLPPLIDRFSMFATRILVSNSKLGVEEIHRICRERFYYDLAGFSMQNQIHGTLRWAGTDRLLYGSDYPYTPAEGIAFQAAIMDEEARKLWSDDVIERVYALNAKSLFTK